MKNYLLVAVVALLSIPGAGGAATIFSLPSVVAAPGSTGNSFDLVLSYTGPAAMTVGGFSFEITTTNSAISFTDATTSTATPYIFGANSLFGPDIATGPHALPGQTIDASDLDSLGSASLVAGTYGLGHVTFDVASGAASGPFTITLTELGSSLSDPNGNNIPITFSNGTITINPAETVPEPSSLTLVIAALGGVLAWGKRSTWRP